MDAHLLFDIADRNAVASAQGAILFHQELRHDEKRDAPGPLATAGRLGQHQVDDVVRKVVIARRDEDLLPGDPVAAVVLRFGLGADHAQIGAGMGFGQVHRAGPVEADHLRQEGLFLVIRPVGEDGRDRAMGQALIHVEGHVGGDEDLPHGSPHDVGQVLPAIVLGQIKTVPAAFLHRREGFLEAFRRVDDAVFQPTAFAVAAGVQGRQHVAGDLARLFEDRGGEAGLKLTIARHVAGGDAQNLIQDKFHVADRGGVGRHECLSLKLVGRVSGGGQPEFRQSLGVLRDHLVQFGDGLV